MCPAELFPGILSLLFPLHGAISDEEMRTRIGSLSKVIPSAEVHRHTPVTRDPVLAPEQACGMGDPSLSPHSSEQTSASLAG